MIDVGDNLVRANTIDGLQAEIDSLERRMWGIIRQLVADPYDSVWDQFKDLDKAQAISVDIRALRKARSLLEQAARKDSLKQAEAKCNG